MLFKLETLEIVKQYLVKEFQSYNKKLNWMISNNYIGKVCLRENNPFNLELDYFDISKHKKELEKILNKIF